MPQWRPRETRRTVRITVRVRTETGWIDATVRNLSQRGMGLSSHQPLRRNQFVEIARGPSRVVGRIVWSDEADCGLRAQDVVDIAGFLAGPQGASPQRENDRRAGNRVERHAALAVPLHQQAQSARWFGRALEFAVITTGVVCAAGVAVGSVLEILGAPLEQVGIALTRAPG